MHNGYKNIFCIFLLAFFLVGFSQSPQALQQVEIRIKDHLFYPSTVHVKAGEKIKVVLINQDPSAEEFESYDLNREKIIAGNSKAVIYISALKPGEYKFFGEFYPKTAQGKFVVK